MRIAVSAALAAAALAHAPAQAAIRYCNQTSYVLYAALAEDAGAVRSAIGWLRLWPGQCRDAFGANPRDGTYYSFAETSPAHSGDARIWAGSERTCVPPLAFPLRDPITAQAPATADCVAEGLTMRRFSRATTQWQAQPVTTFTEPNGPATLETARWRGFARLLFDAAVEDIRPTTARSAAESALERFRQRNNLTDDMNGDAGATFARLEAAASAARSGTGLELCNSTGDALWTAVGWDDARGGGSKGWWRIGPGECVKALPEALGARAYFLHAALDGAAKRVWGGADVFCTAAVSFAIDGRGDCANRGFDETGFMRLETGASRGFRFEFRLQ